MSTAQASRRSSRRDPPESRTRPVVVPLQQPPPEPPTEPVDAVAIRAARRADEYAELRVEQAALEERRRTLEEALKRDMSAAQKKRFVTQYGLVSYTPAGQDKSVVDADASVALLESRGIPQPPTLEDWLKQHGLTVPTKIRPGVPEKIEFRRAE